jgi:hypothetical protein
MTYLLNLELLSLQDDFFGGVQSIISNYYTGVMYSSKLGVHVAGITSTLKLGQVSQAYAVVFSPVYSSLNTFAQGVRPLLAGQPQRRGPELNCTEFGMGMG